MARCGFLETCEKYFGCTSLYDLFGLPSRERSTKSEVKRAYYTLCLSVHPDKCNDDEKEIATLKFQIVGKAYAVLSDENEKNYYDKTGLVSDEGVISSDADYFDLWRKNKLDIERIERYREEYIGSNQERNDIRNAYLIAKGDMDIMLEHIFFVGAKDESRIRIIVDELIKKKEVPEYDVYTNEPKAKKMKRLRKAKREERLLNSESVPGNSILQIASAAKGVSRLESVIARIESVYSKAKAKNKSLATTTKTTAKKRSRNGSDPEKNRRRAKRTKTAESPSKK